MNRRAKRRNKHKFKKILNQLAVEKLRGSYLSDIETWGGTTCPECYRLIPARFFIPQSNCHFKEGNITIAAHCDPSHCVKNDKRYPINLAYKKQS